MTQLHMLDQSRTGPFKSASERVSSSQLSRTCAEVACEPFFAMAAAAEMIDADQRTAIADAVIEVLHVESGRQIPVEKRHSSSLYLLVEGWAVRSLILSDGSRQITDILLPGDLFDQCDADFDTIDDVRACGPARIARLRGVTEGEQEEPTLRRALGRAHRREAMTLRSRLASVGRRDARGRLVHLLRELYHRLGPLGLAREGAFKCPMTQEQLADALGLTSVHVNRTLQALRRCGLITLHKREVMIPDLARRNADASID